MKSAIRTKIESILDREVRIVYIDTTNKAKSKYRMKLCTKRATPIQEQEIMKLPHVLSVRYFESRLGFYSGIAVYFDCKPSQIKL